MRFLPSALLTSDQQIFLVDRLENADSHVDVTTQQVANIEAEDEGDGNNIANAAAKDVVNAQCDTGDDGSISSASSSSSASSKTESGSLALAGNAEPSGASKRQQCIDARLRYFGAKDQIATSANVDVNDDDRGAEGDVLRQGVNKYSGSTARDIVESQSTDSSRHDENDEEYDDDAIDHDDDDDSAFSIDDDDDDDDDMKLLETWAQDIRSNRSPVPSSGSNNPQTGGAQQGFPNQPHSTSAQVMHRLRQAAAVVAAREQ
uniref:Uncharacterized protein n=1 Tax=Craspedostauros australis TaxID=1486917 RepID=A0A7R9ZJ74_9STRA|mmetsp:Transcript_12706/g.35064  ORF Transcript_12706/g.35064 Transcript_12706/m.35064 type:complete len:261 (+) Transcript_12706:117-899(+)|eukprot:CAMPEP_0198113982 /NCGR_PEP_ID=MMETSP1442-20131203/5502_1 /TAXON_ID= /ORGANISM="Craspedostauros australis, Strain CCMP3328" /LENGTH=260 /DNA_ID=CAMNT_0043771193 /DNA_START=115 /DNA_END=897 /DNA_ORIENTATION=-